MREKFIKLTNGSDEIYLDPQLISYMRKDHMYGNVTLYMFGGQIIGVKEDIDTVLKLIKGSETFKFTFDKNDKD